MEKIITARKQKRIESDKRILRATVELVGERGYSQANLRDIAKLAGISPGLISQRFGTKENLLVQTILSTNTVWKERSIPIDTNVGKVLRGIIREAKKTYEEDATVYRFLQVITCSSDIPKEVLDYQANYYKESGMKNLFEKAQKEGHLPEGNMVLLFNIFVSHTLKLILDFDVAGLKIPEDENILAMIQYKE